MEQGNRGTGEQGNSLSRKTRATDDADSFAAFWDAYDKKHGKKAAQAKYRLALKKPGVTPELLLHAAREYVGWQMAEGKHPEFTKDPATWLNGEHWNDERATHFPKRTAGDQRVADALTLAQRLADDDQPNLRAIGQS